MQRVSVSVLEQDPALKCDSDVDLFLKIGCDLFRSDVICVT